ncbi:hypothetical protein [Bacillus benzoevorans]|uniref:Fe-S cluster assembly iron-binding protein IscA n=1 Tax=Bacillus benzoevorans TaxID=1456 RepID=A0A7X0HV06_9BACI|nr:hypothetical protein [Bacillus benzoevorans]MBB6447397.1 Fe-S cluster assembly iron-binding protein IscA [Bacillus benzoevorans]
MFTITNAAQEVLERAIKQEQQNEDEKLYVRLAIGISSCTPQLLTLSLEEKPIRGDQVYPFDHIDILIHEDEFKYFHHKQLDYIRDALGEARFQLIKL